MSAYGDVLLAAHRIHQAAKALGPGALDRALDDADRAEALGPLMDPTLFGLRAQALREDIEVLRKVRELSLLGIEPHEACQRRGGICDCGSRPCALKP